MWEFVIMVLGIVVMADVAAISILFEAEYKSLPPAKQKKVEAILAPLGIAGFGIALLGFGMLIGWF